MNVESVSPLHVVTTSSSWADQILVRYKPGSNGRSVQKVLKRIGGGVVYNRYTRGEHTPENGRNDGPGNHGVDKDNPNDKLHAGDDPYLCDHGEYD